MEHAINHFLVFENFLKWLFHMSTILLLLYLRTLVLLVVKSLALAQSPPWGI
jgi:hypothetical protein